MPVTLYQEEVQNYIIKTLSFEIDLLNSRIEETSQADKIFKHSIKMLDKFNRPFIDVLQNYKQTFAFIAVLAMENNIVLRNLLLSKSKKEELPLIKNGIITMHEGCKRLIGFSNKNGNDKMIKSSLLYKIYSKFEIESPLLYDSFVKHINVFRDKLQNNNTKKLRDMLVHFHESEGDFNPFIFIEYIFGINVDDVFSILWDYRLFLTEIGGLLLTLMHEDNK